jgi:hypothetical protein
LFGWKCCQGDVLLVLKTPVGGWQLEKKYVARCVLEEFLNISSSIIEVGTENDWVLGDGEKWISFPNLFFPEHAPGSYLTEKHLDPWRNQARFVNSERLKVLNYPNADVPVLFAKKPTLDGEIDEVEGIDIFGSIFFFVTRYEEFVEAGADDIGRFSSGQSMTARFVQRPVVDEYLWLLADRVRKLFPELELGLSGYRLELSHDVDVPHSWLRRNGWVLLRSMARGLLKEVSPSQTWRRLRSYFDVRHDPIFCFDWMMDEAESRGLTSTFYILAGGDHPYDLKYDLKSEPIQILLQAIKRRGHNVGVHGSIESAVDDKLLAIERMRLENEIGIPVTRGRQHFLRFCAPLSWQAMAVAGISEDSTVGYHDSAGFRCGTSRSFPVFDVSAGKELPVREQPLICMEHSLLAEGYQGLRPEDAYDYAKGLWIQVKKFGGNFTLLWHNHNLVTDSQRELFKNILNDAL